MLENVNLWCVGFKFIPCPLFPGPIKLLHIHPIHSHQPACLHCKDGLHLQTMSQKNKSPSFKWLLVRERKAMNTTVLEKKTATYSLPLPTSRQSLNTPCSYALSHLTVDGMCQILPLHAQRQKETQKGKKSQHKEICLVFN